jgi:hypothetical protein
MNAISPRVKAESFLVPTRPYKTFFPPWPVNLSYHILSFSPILYLLQLHQLVYGSLTTSGTLLSAWLHLFSLVRVIIRITFFKKWFLPTLFKRVFIQSSLFILFKISTLPFFTISKYPVISSLHWVFFSFISIWQTTHFNLPRLHQSLPLECKLQEDIFFFASKIRHNIWKLLNHYLLKRWF